MSIANAAARGRAAARIVGGMGFTLLLTFIGLTAVTFVIGRVMPADPVLAIVGDRAPQDVYDLVYAADGPGPAAVRAVLALSRTARAG